MDRQPSTLSVHYIRQIADQLRSMGRDVAGWLATSAMSEAQLAAPGFQPSYREFERLVMSALAVSDEPALGLFVGQRLMANSHGIVGFAVLSSSTIRQGLELLERYTQLRTSLVTSKMVASKQSIRISFTATRPLGALERPVLEAIILSIKNVLQAATMGVCQVSEVAFPFAAPDYEALARAMFGCQVTYRSSWAGLAVPADVLDKPLTTADPEAFGEAAAFCQRELEKLTAEMSLSAKVRRVLFETPHGFPTLPLVARSVRMTPRTLHRRLQDEGTSYRELLEAVRHARAVEYVKAGRFTIEEIAYTLGYADPPSFRRAFKRWEKVPPSTFRAQLAVKQ